MVERKEVILGVTASISIYKSCEILRRLQDKGFIVTVVMTEEAQELIKPLVFQSLSGNKVYSGLFDMPQIQGAEHISLAKKADLILVAPATANIIAKVACGICDDLLSCVISAAKGPVLFCPAMNENMYTNRITQENIKKLRTIGYKFVVPSRGRLACADVGIGCLADIDTIVKEAQKAI